MTKRRINKSYGRKMEYSLVPLADMLTNTLGITLFILIFTVLSTASSTSERSFPLEHASKKKPLMVLCAFNKIYAADIGAVAQELFLGPNNKQSLNIADLQRKIETPDFVFEGKVSLSPQFRFLVVITPQASGGQAAGDSMGNEGRFARLLSTTDASERFLFFMVAPDSIGAFLRARDASAKRGFENGSFRIQSKTRSGLSLPAVAGAEAEQLRNRNRVPTFCASFKNIDERGARSVSDADEPEFAQQCRIAAALRLKSGPGGSWSGHKISASMFAVADLRRRTGEWSNADATAQAGLALDPRRRDADACTEL